MSNTMKSKDKQFWEQKAETYPRFQPNADDTLQILDFFRQCGESFKGKTILDIGCGNGRFTLELAKEAKVVYGIDISSKMLEYLEEDAKKCGIRNIKLLNSVWLECDTDSLKTDFEIVFASMTPALNNKKAFLKALELAKKSFCYVGWGRKRECEFLEAIFREHKLEFQLPFGLPNVLQWLEEEGLATPQYRYMPNGYEYNADTQKAFEEVRWHINMHGGIPNEEIIHKHIKRHQNKGKISYYQDREVGIAYIVKD